MRFKKKVLKNLFEDVLLKYLKKFKISFNPKDFYRRRVETSRFCCVFFKILREKFQSGRKKCM